MEDLTLYQLAASCVAVLESAGVPEEGIFSFRYLAGKAVPESSQYGENDELLGAADGTYPEDEILSRLGDAAYGDAGNALDTKAGEGHTGQAGERAPGSGERISQTEEAAQGTEGSLDLAGETARESEGPGSAYAGSLTQESGDEPGDEKTRDALSLVRACTKSADLLKELLRRPDPDSLPDAAACAALGSAAAAILGCAEGASLHVYAGTRLFRDRTRAKSLNSSALREIKKVRKAVEEVREKVFKELTTL